MTSMASRGKFAIAPSPPPTSANRKNIGTPIGTPIASAWPTEPVRTPRRVIALFKPKEAAERAARTAPSTWWDPREARTAPVRTLTKTAAAGEMCFRQGSLEPAVFRVR